MKSDPPLQDSPETRSEVEAERFQPTRWSIVLRSRGDGSQARKAMEDLCRLYWFPLYAWCRARGKSAHDAEDLIQGFFLQILRNDLFHSADPAKGKLRTFLLTALQRYVRDETAKASSLKRGGGSIINIGPNSAEACYARSLSDHRTPEETYDRQWALTVLDHAIGQLEKEAAAKGKHRQFLAMRPFLTDQGGMQAYAKAAEQIDMSPSAFKVAVHRLRNRFRQCLHDTITDTQLEGEANPGEELAYLAKVLGRG